MEVTRNMAGRSNRLCAYCSSQSILYDQICTGLGRTDMANAIMLQGTGSDVGKTVLVAGLCRAAANRGIAVLAVQAAEHVEQCRCGASADDGGFGEIGRAQWLQAVACRAPSQRVDMNPVLIKPAKR
jgi:adenosylcobyric acid synthase